MAVPGHDQRDFDFATKYYYDHTLDNPAEFELTPAVYQEFTDHVTGSSFSFETRTEKALEKALTDREEVIFTETIENDFKTLLADIEKSKLRALDTYSDEITRQLEDEIIKRYLYREGLYEYYLEKDAAILTAREVLGQPRRYSEILQGP